MSRTHTPVTPELAAYIREVTVREPAALKRLRTETEEHPEASCQIAPEQGQFLQVLARAAGAVQAIEVGVFMGYSSTWIALGLRAGGKLTACDLNPVYAERARRTWREAGVEDRIELRLGPAITTLDTLLAEGRAGTFDLVFIDADKGSYIKYYERSVALVRAGGVIAADNVLWRGRVADTRGVDEDTEVIRAFNERVRTDRRVLPSILPIGDGLTVACKL